MILYTDLQGDHQLTDNGQKFCHGDGTTWETFRSMDKGQEGQYKEWTDVLLLTTPRTAARLSKGTATRTVTTRRLRNDPLGSSLDTTGLASSPDMPIPALRSAW